jgi:hypothetical protein
MEDEMSGYETHMTAIRSGEVTKTNVIGMRKALNAAERAYRGWSTGSTSPKVDPEQAEALLLAVENARPRVVGELHDTGLAVLKNRRHRKALERVQYIIDDLKEFRLSSYDALGRHGEYHVPVYKAVSNAGHWFTFRNIPWQSGGNGPEVLVVGSAVAS